MAEPTTEEKVAALHDSVTDLHKKFDAFMAKHAKKDDDDDDDDDRRKDAKKDDNEEDDEGEHDKDGEPKKDAKRKDAEGKDIEEWAKEEKKEPEHKDDKKKDAKKDADPDATPEEEGEPKPMASDDKDAKKDDDDDDDDDDRARKDSAEFRRRLSRLERSRVRTDEELNALAEAQQQWDGVAQQFGERAHRPLDGETLKTYNRRHVVRFQKHSPRWKDMDFSTLPPEVVQVAMPDIRADATEAAKRGLIGQPELREIVRYDRTGRKISEFIGDIAVTLAPFRLPSMRVRGGRINTRPNEY